jgi:hypothetical protein
MSTPFNYLSPYGYGKGPFGQIPYGEDLFQGLTSLIIEDLMEDIALALVEPLVNTLLGKNVAPGNSLPQTMVPPSMVGIYSGALLLAGTVENIEQITVLTVTSDSFTAVFKNQHYASEYLVGSTFPSGQIDHPLFTQQEILGYIADVQNEFLLKTRSIYGVTGTFSEPPDIEVEVGNRFYAQPEQAIRVERIFSLVLDPGIDLYETTQSDLDLGDYAWPATPGPPSQWFRDQIDTGIFGVYPNPNVTGSLELWYSKRGPLGNAGVLTLLSTLLIPDVMVHYVKYGVLSLCWGKDGESHNPLRAEYCQKRFDLGIVLVNRFMEGIGIQAQPKDGKTFSPMAIASSGEAEATGG